MDRTTLIFLFIIFVAVIGAWYLSLIAFLSVPWINYKPYTKNATGGKCLKECEAYEEWW